MDKKYEVSALILRVVLGFSFFMHGLVKFQSGIGNIVGWFESIGLPGFLAYGVALVELVGGIALILGLFSRVFAGLFAFIMMGAIVKVKLAAGFLGNGQMSGYELDVAFLAMSIILALFGSKLYAVDQLFMKKEGSIDISQ